MNRRRLTVVLGAVGVLTAAAVALVLVFALGGGSEQPLSKFASDPDAAASGNESDSPGLGPVSYDAYLSAERTYPANVIPPAVVENAKATFEKIRGKGDDEPDGKKQQWLRYGPQENAVQPGVTSFSGATNTTASRVTALVVAPTCTARSRRLWGGVPGGGVWRTDDALASNPSWTWLTEEIGQNSVGTLTA